MWRCCTGRAPTCRGSCYPPRADPAVGASVADRDDRVAAGAARRGDLDHIAFGNGPHVCLGQHIARIEIDAMLVEVLSRMEDVERTAPPEWLASNFISGPRTMPVRFRAGRKVGVG